MITSFTKIFGFSIGLAACMMIILYIMDELSFDRFHSNYKNIYRITETVTDASGKRDPGKSGNTPLVAGPSFKEKIPEITNVVRIKNNFTTIKSKNDLFPEKILYVDPPFFNLFNFPFVEGSANSFFSQSNSLLLSEEAANKYFGNLNVLGKTLSVRIQNGFEDFVIAGILKNVPGNSTIQFNILAPLRKFESDNPDDQWIGGNAVTFISVNQQSDLKNVESKLNEVFQSEARNQIREAQKNGSFSDKITLGLEPIKSIHFDNEIEKSNGLTPGNDRFYMYVLGIIAAFILLIATVNFINLSIAQSVKRAKEIGIRKVSGGSKTQLIVQFLVESFATCLASFIVAYVLALSALPLFNSITGKKLELNLYTHRSVYVYYFLLLIAASILAGIYPALVMSSHNTRKLFFGSNIITSKSRFSRGLISIQFVIGTVLIFSTIVIFSQFHYLTKASLGYDDKNLIVIWLPQGSNNNNLVKEFKNELSTRPSVLSISGKNGGTIQSEAKVDGQKIRNRIFRIDDNYFSTLQIPFKEGRGFSDKFSTDWDNAVVVNETFAKEAGWKNINGKEVSITGTDKKVPVIGMVKDYHFNSLKEKITPQIFLKDSTIRFGELWIRVGSENISSTLQLLKTTYKKLVPYAPYDYEFNEISNKENYSSEANLRNIITYSTILMIAISCLGLWCLIFYAMQQRTKEIGIRKTLGASVYSIVRLLNQNFLQIISISIVVGIPIGYYAMHKWLELFPYRIEIHWWMLVATGLSILMISIVTITSQTFKAANINPIKSLRAD